jgi:membrane fusion protein (multidrug efflux system)
MEKKKRVIGGFAAAVLIFSVYFGYKHYVYVETDNAQVSAHVVMLSSRVNGTITKVMVDENQRVKKGEVMAQIDTSDYSTVSEAAQSQVASLQARYNEAEIGYKRATELVRSQAIPRERFDAAQAAFKDTGAKLKQAQAQLEQANLNVSYTKIVAPTDGTVARKSVEPGQFVSVGQPLFGFVDQGARWITANLKETEIENVIPGRKSSIEVDAIGDKSFKGEVESIGPSTGATFSLLPPDNATGNFTKVVQRVPVRIKFLDLTADDINRLQAGLSAQVSIRVH